METNKLSTIPIIVGLALKIEVAVAFLFLSEGPTTLALLFAGGVAIVNHLCEFRCKDAPPRKRLCLLLGWSLPISILFLLFLIASTGFKPTSPSGEFDWGGLRALFLLVCCFWGVLIFGRLVAFGSDILWHRLRPAASRIS